MRTIVLFLGILAPVGGVSPLAIFSAERFALRATFTAGAPAFELPRA